MKRTKRLCILYAENNEDSGQMIRMLLGFSDIDVLLARSIKEAFQSARNKHFDLYLIDGCFPDGTGLELCRELREFNPEIPIVLYSGDAYEADKQKGLAAGANAYLFKPDVDTIAPAIFRLVTPNSQINSAGIEYPAPEVHYVRINRHNTHSPAQRQENPWKYALHKYQEAR